MSERQYTHVTVDTIIPALKQKLHFLNGQLRIKGFRVPTNTTWKKLFEINEINIDFNSYLLKSNCSGQTDFFDSEIYNLLQHYKRRAKIKVWVQYTINRPRRQDDVPIIPTRRSTATDVLNGQPSASSRGSIIRDIFAPRDRPTQHSTRPRIPQVSSRTQQEEVLTSGYAARPAPRPRSPRRSTENLQNDDDNESVLSQDNIEGLDIKAKYIKRLQKIPANDFLKAKNELLALKRAARDYKFTHYAGFASQFIMTHGLGV